jgi:hypothetical protein
MITKSISTPHGDCSSTSEITFTDNGQTLIHVVSKLGDAQHSHVVTVGSEDGKDAVADMSEDDLKSHLQGHLDKIRTHAANILSGRAKVSKIVGGLS